MTKRSVTKQGQSDSTEDKERGLEAAFTINMRVFHAKFGNRYPYWHFDLNSGNGWNDKVNCIGSPLAFLRAASRFDALQYFSMFCDKDGQAIKTLLARPEIATNPQAFCFHGDNASLIEAIPYMIRHARERADMAMGMVLSDPNGFETPLDELADLAKKCPKIDFAIHWNSRIRKLYRGQGWDFVDIDEAINKLDKQHWLIRNPLGAHQWTVLIGRNTRLNDHRAMGYHHLESDMGQHIHKRCKARLDGDDDDCFEQMAMEL